MTLSTGVVANCASVVASGASFFAKPASRRTLRLLTKPGRFGPATYRAIALLAALLAPTTSVAITLPINFTGTNQQAFGSLSISGDVGLNGAGAAFNPLSGKVEPFTFTPPLTHSFNVLDPIKIATNPYSVDFPWHRNLLSPITPPATQFTFAGGQLTEMQDFDFDVYLKQYMPIPAPALDFYVEPFNFTTNSKVSLLKNVSVDFSGEFQHLGFEQTGAATLTPTGPGQGTFSVPGEGVVRMFTGNLILAGAFQIPIGMQPPVTPVELTGTYSVLNPGPHAQLHLYGAVDITFPLFASPQLATAVSVDSPVALTISATLDLPVSTRLQMQYQFVTDFAMVPEPGSVALLAVGLLAVVPTIYVRWRHAKAPRS